MCLDCRSALKTYWSGKSEATKYKSRSSKCSHDHRHHSKGEAECCDYLHLLQSKGELSDLTTQVRVRLKSGEIEWGCIPDFSAYDKKLGETVYYEYKSSHTAELGRWKQTKKYWRLSGPGRLKVIMGRELRMQVTEEIVPGG
jgi:hypothetical protein